MKKRIHVGQKFNTLSDWNDTLKGKTIMIIKPGHAFQYEKCSFVEMVGKHEVLTHKDNNKGKEIKCKVKTPLGNELLLSGGEFMILEKTIVQRVGQN